MSEHRQLRSNQSVNLTMLEDTPRRLSKKSGLLSSTPSKRGSAEMGKRSSSVREVKRPRGRPSQQQQQQDTMFSDDEMEDGDPLVQSDKNHNITNNTSRFDDKPEHLYGLDNPTNISSDNKEENDQIRTKTGDNVQANPITKLYKCSTIIIVCFCFCFLAVLMGLLTDIHNQKQQHEEDTAEIKLLKNRISKLEQAQSNQGIKSFQDHAYQKVFLKEQSISCGEGQPVENLIQEALRRWDADKIGIPDYALESAGGQIHGSYHSPTFANGAIPQVLVFGIPVWYEVKKPRLIIQPGNTPGECWAFHGSSGFVVIKLSRLIKPSSFTLEHMATSLSQFEDHSIPSAPKEFSVWGWADARGNEKSLLGEYVYANGGHALQNFPVQANTVPEFRFIELKVHSNYGNPVFTCLYRFRVHGSPYKTNN